MRAAQNDTKSASSGSRFTPATTASSQAMACRFLAATSSATSADDDDSGHVADRLERLLSSSDDERDVAAVATALAALPLFGLGQFFLRGDPDTWARAQKLLAFYLFASLSLLVTTSFLGLAKR